jgi:hypothetical protein
MKMAVSWNVVALTVETASFTETSVSIYHTERRDIPQESHILYRGVFLFYLSMNL